MHKSEIIPMMENIFKRVFPESEFSRMDFDQPVSSQIRIESVDFLEIVVLLESEYNIFVHPKDYKFLKSIDNFITYIEKKK